MHDAPRDPAALELLRVQRDRLAERMRPPWWYLAGIAFLYALVFAVPFTTRYLGLSIWPVFLVALAVAWPLQWGMTRATGIKMGYRNLRYPAAGRPVRIAIAAVSVGGIVTVHFLVERGLPAVAVAAGAIAVAAEVILQQAALRGIREELRAGGGAV